MLQELLLCSTVAMKKELRLLATCAWAAEGAAGAAFRWLLRLRARGRYRAGAGARGSPAKRGLIPCLGASSRSREELIIALGSYEQFNGPTSWDQVPTSPPTLPQPLRPGQILRRQRPYPQKGQKLKGWHKISEPWEGPYMVAEIIRPGAYRLKDSKGNLITNAWNIKQLRRFYS